MSPPPSYGAAFVIRPTVVLTMAYLLVLRVWSIWFVATMTWDDLLARGEGESFVLLTNREFGLVSLINLMLTSLLLLEWRSAWRGERALRAAQLCGVGLALVSLCALQWLAWQTWGTVKELVPG